MEYSLINGCDNHFFSLLQTNHSPMNCLHVKHCMGSSRVRMLQNSSVPSPLLARSEESSPGGSVLGSAITAVLGIKSEIFSFGTLCSLRKVLYVMGFLATHPPYLFLKLTLTLESSANSSTHIPLNFPRRVWRR